MKILGNKNKIGLQIQRPDNPRSKFGLWIDGRLLGSLTEEESLKFVQLQLLRLIKFDLSEALDSNILDGLSIDFLLRNEDKFLHQVIFSLGVSFDDFIIRYIPLKEEVIIFWKFVPSPFHKYKHYDLLGESYKTILNKDDIRKIINDLDNLLDKIDKF